MCCTNVQLYKITPNCFLMQLYHIPTRNVKERSHIHSLQHLVFSGYLNFINPVDVKWHPIVFPICISLSKSEVVYLFMCIRHICFLFSEMPSPIFSLYFSIGIFFHPTCRISLLIPILRLFLVLCVTNTYLFPQGVTCLSV